MLLFGQLLSAQANGYLFGIAELEMGARTRILDQVMAFAQQSKRISLKIETMVYTQFGNTWSTRQLKSSQCGAFFFYRTHTTATSVLERIQIGNYLFTNILINSCLIARCFRSLEDDTCQVFLILLQVKVQKRENSEHIFKQQQLSRNMTLIMVQYCQLIHQ